MEQKHTPDDGKTVVIELKHKEKEKSDEDITLTHSSLYPVKKGVAAVLRHPFWIAGILLAALIIGVFMLLSSFGGETPPDTDTETDADTDTAITTGSESSVTTPNDSLSVTGLSSAPNLGTDIHSGYALLCDVESLSALAVKEPTARMYPASLTKIMTFLVAYDELTDHNKQLTLTKAIKKQYPEASRVGIEEGDIITVKQCLYAMMLASDTDSVLLLAEEAAGSEAEFVKLMNQKAIELGLTSTHFANATGLHDPSHYSTASEMAIIFAEALKNELFHSIVTTKEYSTYLGYYKNGAYTTYHFLFKNTTFSSRIDQYAKPGQFGEVTPLGGKTGFTDEAAICQALLCADKNGKEYIIITAKAGTVKKCVNDLAYIAKYYIP